MDALEATFPIESKSDAHAVERLLERVYDAVREESRTVREGTGDASAVLEEFRALRDAARRPAAGKLTVVYERRDESFGE